jgi:hypothetical protein
MDYDPQRAICGVATAFDVPSKDGDVWTAEDFDLVIGLELPVPLKVDHGILVGRWGLVGSVGTIYRFAHVTYPLNGMLILGQVDFAHGFGDSILHDLRLTLQQRYMPPVWGFSVGGWQDPDTGKVVLKEVSLSRRQAYSDARVLAVAEDAPPLFEMLTERRAVGRH